MKALKILGIDFSALYRRSWEATGGNELSEAHNRTLRTVAEIREGFDRVALLCDGGTSFRQALSPTYKADRERPPAPYYEQMDRTLDRLTRDGCSLFDPPRVTIGDPTDTQIGEHYAEADDLMGSLASWCIRGGHSLTIYGNDKDLLQLVDDAHSIVAWRPDSNSGVANLKERWDSDAVSAKFGVPPSMIASLLALAGDKSDGFKMFAGWEDESGKHPGIGVGVAAKLLQKFGSFSGVIDAINGVDGEGLPLMKDGHVKEVLRRAKPTPLDAALLGLRLATLVRDLPVDFDVLLAPPVFAPLVAIVPDAPEDTDRQAQLPPESTPRAEPNSNATMRTTSDALARIDATTTGIDRYALQPRDPAAMMRMAEWLYDSRLYGQYPNHHAIFAVMLEANERGVPVGLALRNGYVVKSRTAWSAQFIGALVLASGKARVFRIIESTAQRAVLEYQRDDEAGPSLFEFTIEEARAAGWMKSGEKGDNKWITNPRTMLRWAAIREGARAFFFDVVAGMHTPDEIRGHATDDDMRNEEES